MTDIDALLSGREWFGLDGAPLEALTRLQAASPASLPGGYYSLLSKSNGGEGPLPVMPFNLCLDPVDEVVHRLTTGNYGQSDFDGFVIFGGSGGGEYLAFDVRGPKPWPIVHMDMVAGGGSVQVITPDFDAFLMLIGISS